MTESLTIAVVLTIKSLTICINIQRL